MLFGKQTFIRKDIRSLYASFETGGSKKLPSWQLVREFILHQEERSMSSVAALCKCECEFNVPLQFDVKERCDALSNWPFPRPITHETHQQRRKPADCNAFAVRIANFTQQSWMFEHRIVMEVQVTKCSKDLSVLEATSPWSSDSPLAQESESRISRINAFPCAFFELIVLPPFEGTSNSDIVVRDVNTSTSNAENVLSTPRHYSNGLLNNTRTGKALHSITPHALPINDVVKVQAHPISRGPAAVLIDR